MHRLGALGRHLLPAGAPPCPCPCSAADAQLDSDGIVAGAVPHDAPILDMACESIRGFSLDEFLIEGRWYWRGAMLPWVARSWTAALQRVQKFQDDMILQDWSEFGWEQPTPEQKQLMLGGSGSTGRPSFGLFKPRSGEAQQPSAQSAGAKLPLNPGSWPEHFVVGSDAFLMSVFTHPQMLQLHRMMLGPQIRFDHTTLLNRTPGFMGQRYHSHPFTEDNLGVTTNPGGAALRMTRTLCYPQGFAAANDAGLKVVRGSHLYRENGGHGDLYNIGESHEERELDPAKADAVLAEGWLKGKRNPISGAPLRVEREALPPGSMASILHHTLHGVDPKDPSAETRWCCLLGYRAPEPATGSPIRSSLEDRFWSESENAAGEIGELARAAGTLFDEH